jgi:hypothetical protein
MIALSGWPEAWEVGKGRAGCVQSTGRSLTAFPHVSLSMPSHARPIPSHAIPCHPMSSHARLAAARWGTVGTVETVGHGMHPRIRLAGIRRQSMRLRTEDARLCQLGLRPQPMLPLVPLSSDAKGPTRNTANMAAQWPGRGSKLPRPGRC